MKLRYLRLHAFQALLQPVSRRARSLRMREFSRRIPLRRGARVLDLGGHPAIWESVSTPLDITILNLPGSVQELLVPPHRFTYVEGDACNMFQFHDREFEIVFSNSVIEHVGPEARQRAMASEVQRVGGSFWIQTPSKWFPIESHSGMPFWWFYPEWLRQTFIQHWRPKLPEWTEMIEGTCVLSRAQLSALFPNAAIHVEFLAGIPKSYSAYRSYEVAYGR